VIYDSADRVLSLPPIINGHHSRIQLHTKNVFIECTATDLTKANIVLDTVITMFSEYTAEKFTAEAVEVIYEVDPDIHATDKTTPRHEITPQLFHRECDAKVNEINGTLGLNLTPETMVKLCDRMQLGPAVYHPEVNAEAGGVIRVKVPPTRSDILHAVDVIEDVAIAYGFNNIPVQLPSTVTFGAPLPINHFTDLLRAEIARAGYSEMLTHGLVSRAENYTNLNHADAGNAVSLSNPANVEYEVVRTTLIPGALKTLAFNNSLSHKDGIRLFEISDVVLATPSDDVGAKNERHLVACYSAFSSSFEVIHGLADKIMTWVQIQPESQYGAMSLTNEDILDRKRVGRENLVYYVRSCEDGLYFSGMAAEIVIKNIATGTETVVGNMGVVHPNVLAKFDVDYPCTILEMNLELLM
jgi:phenylalanyl-tRNA synthetase beta chain